MKTDEIAAAAVCIFFVALLVFLTGAWVGVAWVTHYDLAYTLGKPRAVATFAAAELRAPGATATAAASALATAEAPNGGGNAPHSAVPTATPREGNMGADVPGGHYAEFTIRGGEPLSAVSEGWREGFGPAHPVQVGGATTQLTFNNEWPSTECRTEKRPHKWDGPTVKAGNLTFVRCRYCDLWAQKR